MKLKNIQAFKIHHLLSIAFGSAGESPNEYAKSKQSQNIMAIKQKVKRSIHDCSEMCGESLVSIKVLCICWSKINVFDGSSNKLDVPS